jgi:hypothetical protein
MLCVLAVFLIDSILIMSVLTTQKLASMLEAAGTVMDICANYDPESIGLANHSIGEFAKNLNVRVIETLVVRAVWSQFLLMVSTGYSTDSGATDPPLPSSVII